MKEKLTLKQKDKIVRTIYRNYQRAQLDILYMNQHYNYYPQIDIFKVKEPSASSNTEANLLNQLERKQYLEEYVSVMNQLHSHLSKESYFFIENEYLNFYDTNWWIHLFSKATYYRLKHRALDELLEAALSFWSEKEMLLLLKP